MRVIVVDENCKKCGGSGKVDSENCGQVGHFDGSGGFMYNEFVAIQVDCECKRPVELETLIPERLGDHIVAHNRFRVVEKGEL